MFLFSINLLKPLSKTDKRCWRYFIKNHEDTEMENYIIPFYVYNLSFFPSQVHGEKKNSLWLKQTFQWDC